jgi:hypothetical protein
VAAQLLDAPPVEIHQDLFLPLVPRPKRLNVNMAKAIIKQITNAQSGQRDIKISLLLD